MTSHSVFKKKFWSIKSLLISLLGLCLLIVLIYSYTKNYLSSREVNQEIKGLENKITDLRTENDKIKELIKYFDSQAYAEQKARAELSMQKPGETVVVINNDETSQKIATQTDNTNNDQPTNPKKWFRYFFIK